MTPDGTLYSATPPFSRTFASDGSPACCKAAQSMYPIPAAAWELKPSEGVNDALPSSYQPSSVGVGSWFTRLPFDGTPNVFMDNATMAAVRIAVL